MGCSPSGCSVDGISQARILKWVAMPSSRASSWLRGQTHVSCVTCIAGRFFCWATWEALQSATSTANLDVWPIHYMVSLWTHHCSGKLTYVCPSDSTCLRHDFKKPTSQATHFWFSKFALFTCVGLRHSTGHLLFIYQYIWSDLSSALMRFLIHKNVTGFWV